MIGPNVSHWLEKLKFGNQEEKNKSANHLLGTSEWYFDDKKVSSEEKLKIVNDLVQLHIYPDPIVRQCMVY